MLHQTVYHGISCINAGVVMESGRFLIDLAARGRWICVTWRRRLCLYGIALSEKGGGFVVPLVLLREKTAFYHEMSRSLFGLLRAGTEWCGRLFHFVEI